MPHDYLLPLRKLGDDQTKVVFYDRLGVGKSGNWKDSDIRARLPEIEVPTPVTVWRYEVTLKVSETVHKGITGSKLKLFSRRVDI